MTSHPAQVRSERNKRIALRAALAGVRLDPQQLKLVVSAHDALVSKSNALTAESGKVFDRIPAEAGTPALTAAGRRLDQLEKQAEPLDTRAQKLRAHPQVRAAILAREKAEERGQ